MADTSAGVAALTTTSDVAPFFVLAAGASEVYLEVAISETIAAQIYCPNLHNSGDFLQIPPGGRVYLKSSPTGIKEIRGKTLSSTTNLSFGVSQR